MATSYTTCDSTRPSESVQNYNDYFITNGEKDGSAVTLSVVPATLVALTVRM